jgi:hypothetical protein
LKQGAEKIVAGGQPETPSLVSALYERTLGRKPTAKEATLAAKLIGAPAKAEGVEDLLWALAMLPEFQLIK